MISHSETSFLGKFYMHQENNVPFMTKKSKFCIFFSVDTFGHSKKTWNNKLDMNFLERRIYYRFYKFAPLKTVT